MIISTTQDTGLALTAKVFNRDTQIGVDIPLSESVNVVGYYFSAVINTSSYSDGEHTILILDSNDSICGTVSQYFKDGKELEELQLELYEDDLGANRFTIKALEQAPVADVSSLATQTSVDNVQTSVDAITLIVNDILQDTGTDIPATLAAIQSDISNIPTNDYTAILELIRKVTRNNVIKEGNVITIFEDDGTTPHQRYDLSNGGRIAV